MSTGSSAFYQFDPQGNTVSRSDSTAAVLDYHSFDPGGGQFSSATTSDPYAGYEAQYGYYRDAETGFYNVGHRYYSSMIGRFLTQDPIGQNGGVNVYTYAGNNPFSFVDPSGLDDTPGEISAELIADASDPAIVGDEGGAGSAVRTAARGITRAGAARAAGALGAAGAAAEGAEHSGAPVGETCEGLLEQGLERAADLDETMQNLFRVVEKPEQEALGRSQGVPTPSPYQEEKPFFIAFEQAFTYQQERIPPAWREGSQIWQFPNLNGLGHLGPPVDFVPGPTWGVPNEDLPGIGPGWPVK